MLETVNSSDGSSEGLTIGTTELEGEAEGLGLFCAATLGDGLDDAPRVGEGPGDGSGLELGDEDGLGDGAGSTVGEELGVGVDSGVGEGVGVRQSLVVPSDRSMQLDY